MPAWIRFLVCVAAALAIGALWSFITVPYSNPEGIVGPLSKLHFHPLNNQLRYLLFVLVPAILWLMMSRNAVCDGYLAAAAPKTEPGRATLPRLTCVLIWLWAVTEWLQKWSLPWMATPTDLFHLGEIVTPAYLYGLNDGIWTRSFFAHGAFQEVFLVHWGWWVSGRQSLGASIPLLVAAGSSWLFGMAFFLTSLVICVSRSFRPQSASLLGVVFLIVVDLGNERIFQFTSRDSLTLVGFGFLILATLHQTKLLWGVVGLLIPLALLNSIDRGAYLAAVSLVVLIWPALAVSRVAREVLKARLLPCLTGILLGWGVQAAIWGLAEFQAFLSNTFFWIRHKDYLDAWVYPSPLEAQSWLHALPLWVIMLVLLGLAAHVPHYTRSAHQRLASIQLLLATAAFVFFRNGLGRSDLPHLLYSWHFALLALLYLLWLQVSSRTQWVDRLVLPAVWLLGALCLLQTGRVAFGFERILSTPNRIRVISNLPEEDFLEEPQCDRLFHRCDRPSGMRIVPSFSQVNPPGTTFSENRPAPAFM